MKKIEAIIEAYPDNEFLQADGLDDAIIGVTQNSEVLVYSQKKCIEIFIKEGMTETDAHEHFYFNVAGAYVGEKTPIFVEDLTLENY